MVAHSQSARPYEPAGHAAVVLIVTMSAKPRAGLALDIYFITRFGCRISWYRSFSVGV